VPKGIAKPLGEYTAWAQFKATTGESVSGNVEFTDDGVVGSALTIIVALNGILSAPKYIIAGPYVDGHKFGTGCPAVVGAEPSGNLGGQAGDGGKEFEVNAESEVTGRVASALVTFFRVAHLRTQNSRSLCNSVSTATFTDVMPYLAMDDIAPGKKSVFIYSTEAGKTDEVVACAGIAMKTAAQDPITGVTFTFPVENGSGCKSFSFCASLVLLSFAFYKHTATLLHCMHSLTTHSHQPQTLRAPLCSRRARTIIVDFYSLINYRLF
jgi:hypothetical protein